MGFFLVPILFAIVGAILAGGEPDRQFLGAAIGLALGMGGAAVAGRWTEKDDEEPT